MVARRAHNPKVVGSNPASATTKNGLNTEFEPFFFSGGNTENVRSDVYLMFILLKNDVYGG